MVIQRRLAPAISADLSRKLVLLSGPRQVGKTTLARAVEDGAEYLNYDILTHRRRIQREEWDRERSLLILDELHKMRGWKGWLKGVWDGREPIQKILVTGSSRLDTFRRAGDSLAGRFFHHQLHPFTVRELRGRFDPRAAVGRLLLRGGFPEPLLATSDEEAERWRTSHLDRIVRDDVDAIERVRDVRQLELLVELLSERVGSNVSYQNLAEDLTVSAPTVKRWIEVLEALCVVFTVRPYTQAQSRSLRKEPKVYFYDLGRVRGEAARLENLVAGHLLARNSFLSSTKGQRRELHYVRDKERREVDFLTIVDRRPEFLIEVKTADESISPALAYYAARIECPALQLVLTAARASTRALARVAPVASWLADLEA
ncbi:MAG: ATP-binding protein [Candidatus Eisenbacteria bacterium]|nr:ATP-binding protein [Candidatus Eisenbacteria bacterium]